MEKMAGPMNRPPTMNVACLSMGSMRPRLMMPYNPRYYPPLLEGVD
jgi:hypothetical protein